MHLEIQVALNFVVSHLYNKLPRRRVNLFGEELEKALKIKFQGHWYPDKPMKGSAYRCLKTGQPTDAVLERAAVEANLNIADILENLPAEMSVWIDPGEVSYRIGEKGQMKVLWSQNGDSQEEANADREVTKTFNPEAQIFQPIEASRKSVSPYGSRGGAVGSPDGSPFGVPVTSVGVGVGVNVAAAMGNVVNVPPVVPVTAAAAAVVGSGQSPPGFFPPSMGTGGHTQLMTTAAFAQTKFGSTKLKTNAKRTHRMSPTEFSNYIKQRALQQQQQQQQKQQQQQQQQQQQAAVAAAAVAAGQPFMGAGAGGMQRPRSLSPQDFGPFGGYHGGHVVDKYSPFDTIWGGAHGGNAGANGLNSAGGANNGIGAGMGGNNASNAAAAAAAAMANLGTTAHHGAQGFASGSQGFDTNKQLLEGLSLGLNAVPYQGQYQHLLVAN